jgi:arginyl-tRNA synthetase
LVEQTVHALEERGLAEEGVLERPKGKEDDTWTPQPLLLFRSSLFGDDSDRPLKKTSGEWTYLAGDIAYHQNKIGRGFRHLIDVWGADHGSHVSRMQAAVKALSPETTLEIILAQIVHFIKDGQPLKISKRAGTFVTVRDVLEQLDGDVLRFLMVSRKHDSQFTLDLDHAWEHSKDNPVFYVQYAHARACSVLRMGAEMFPLSIPPDALLQAPFSRLVDEAELFLIKGLADWPRQVQKAAATREPHRIVTFLYETAHRFHTLWHKGKKDATLRFLLPDDEALSLARLALMKATCAVIASGLQVLGVTAVQEMR